MKPEIRIEADGFKMRLDIGDGPAKLKDGFGGYTAVDRPDDVALTEWTGQGPIRIDVPVRLDRYAEGQSVEADFYRVLSLGRRRRNPSRRPRPFRVTGPIPFSGERFVLESTPETSDEIRGPQGELQRIHMVLPLMEYVRSDQVEISRKGVGKNRYKVRKGDTLRSIAKKVYDDVAWARLIGRENGIRDVRRELKPGRILRLPATFEITDKPR